MWFREKREGKEEDPYLGVELRTYLMSDAQPGSESAPEALWIIFPVSSFFFFF